VLANLLNNAAKYTDEGGDIWLNAGREGRQAVLSVRDTGAGIAATLLPRVFELFAQAERTLDRSQGGLGIGLTLVKLLVEMHDGTVEARSGGLGQGAEFIVRLPLRESTGAVPSAASADTQLISNGQSPGRPGGPGGPDGPDGPDGQSSGEQSPGSQDGNTEQRRTGRPRQGALRVLVVDDNVDAADSTAMLLSLDGYETHSVHSAQAALESAPSFNPDVVLLDIGLPEMDGYDVAQRLREQAAGAPMALIALTGYGQPADRDRATQAGFDEFLVKPVEPAVLNGLLRSLRSR